MNPNVANHPDADRLSVWIAEEDMGNAEFLRHVFARTGIAEVHHFPDGNSLMSSLMHAARRPLGGKRVPRPHALLLDIHLPGLSGYEVLRQLPPLKNLKVFLITGALREFDELRARSPDVQGLFAKPISLGHVAELMGHFPLVVGRHASGRMARGDSDDTEAPAAVQEECSLISQRQLAAL